MSSESKYFTQSSSVGHASPISIGEENSAFIHLNHSHVRS